MRRRILGWMLFDVAQQPYATLGLTFTFAPYFAAVAAGTFERAGASADAAGAQAQSLWGLAQTLAGLLIAVTAPVLGAHADASGRKLAWIGGLSAIYVACAWSLWWLHPDGTNLYAVLALFWLGFVAGESALNVNNAQLPGLAPPERLGRVSGSGAAMGYWGGVVALVVMLAFFAQDGAGPTLLGHPPALGLDMAAEEGTRAVGPFIALWFALFAVPFFLWTRGAPSTPRPARWADIRRGLGATVRDVLRRPSLGSFLLATMFQRDALGALYSFGGIYATLVLGWTVTTVGVFGVIAAVAAAVVTFLGGLADQRWGPKPVMIASCWALVAVCVLVVGMDRDALMGLPLAPGSRLPDALFFLCGAVIGGAGGALYAASRTLMARHADPARAGEAFGLFALSGKATAFLAPALVALATAITGSIRAGLVPVILLFLLGLGLLAFTRPQGDRSWPASSPPSP